MTSNEKNGRPRKTDRTEASDDSAFEEQTLADRPALSRSFRRTVQGKSQELRHP